MLPLLLASACNVAALDLAQAVRRVEEWKDWSELAVVPAATVTSMVTFVLPPNPGSQEGLRQRAGELIERAQGSAARRRYEQEQRRAKERVWRALARVEQACGAGR